MRHRRRRRRNPLKVKGNVAYRTNPMSAKIGWAVGLTAIAGLGIGTIIYFATKKPAALAKPTAAPPGDGGTVKPAGGTEYTGPAPDSPGKVAVAQSTPSYTTATPPEQFAKAFRYTPPSLSPETGDY